MVPVSDHAPPRRSQCDGTPRGGPFRVSFARAASAAVPGFRRHPTFRIAPAPFRPRSASIRPARAPQQCLTYGDTPAVDAVAFVAAATPEGARRVTVVVINRGSSAVTYTLVDARSGLSVGAITIGAHSLQSLVYDAAELPTPSARHATTMAWLVVALAGAAGLAYRSRARVAVASVAAAAWLQRLRSGRAGGSIIDEFPGFKVRPRSPSAHTFPRFSSKAHSRLRPRLASSRGGPRAAAHACGTGGQEHGAAVADRPVGIRRALGARHEQVPALGYYVYTALSGPLIVSGVTPAIASLFTVRSGP